MAQKVYRVLVVDDNQDSATSMGFLLTMATLTIRTQLAVGFPPGRPPRALESSR